jgi:hypothetical protein
LPHGGPRWGRTEEVGRGSPPISDDAATAPKGQAPSSLAGLALVGLCCSSCELVVYYAIAGAESIAEDATRYHEGGTIVITHPTPQREFQTDLAGVDLCGELRGYLATGRELRPILVANGRNGAAQSATPTETGRGVADWCTGSEVPLELGKNSIAVRAFRLGSSTDTITVTRLAGSAAE